MSIKSLDEKIAKIPDLPGVYLMKNSQGRVIYIGKASQLQKRVKSYFSGKTLASKTLALVNSIRDIEYILTDSAVEALILEDKLIKKIQPWYNIQLKDDKSYPRLKLTLQEDFPRLFTTRRLLSDGARYFGPYPNAGALRTTLKAIKKTFPLRKCRKKITAGQKASPRPCLNYYIQQCLAPCQGKLKKETYLPIVQQVILFLQGRYKDLLDSLQKEMEDAAKSLEFEKAAKLRNQIFALKKITRRMNIREIEEKDITVPTDRQGAIEELKKVLKLPKVPERIEAFDISNLGGKEATGSLVVFIGGEPQNSQYRRYRIKTVRQMDDYQMLAEVMERCYQRRLAESRKPKAERKEDYKKRLEETKGMPDLILIDGGKGQVSAGYYVLKKLGLENTPILGLAKRLEYIFLPNRANPIILKRTSPALHLLEHIRDEAHRFAIQYHRKLRQQKLF